RETDMVKNLLDTSDPFSHDLPNKVDGYISDTLHHVENRSFYLHSSQLLYICVVKNLLDTSDPFSHDLPNKVDGYVFTFMFLGFHLPLGNKISDTLHHVENRSFYIVSQLLYICVEI
ncbi:hypothetical protein ACJX0J_021039, partial [Zea mays]